MSDTSSPSLVLLAAHGFAPPQPTDPHGVVAYDHDLSVSRLVFAYRNGIFPWPHAADAPVPWVSPPRRAVLDFATLHVPRTLRQARARSRLRFTVDAAFAAVLAECAATPRPGQEGTWITQEMQAAYRNLHAHGGAHSVEAWDGETLVGGLYGVDSGGVFTGESMFHRVDNGSKLCLLHLVDLLKAAGGTWMDIQTLTPHFIVLGAREIPRATFISRLRSAQQAGRPLLPDLPC